MTFFAAATAAVKLLLRRGLPPALLSLLWLLLLRLLLLLREGVAQHLPVSTAHCIAQVQDNVRHRQQQPPLPAAPCCVRRVRDRTA